MKKAQIIIVIMIFLLGFGCPKPNIPDSNSTLKKAILYYNTYNSLRHVDSAKNTTSVDWGNGLDFFGLVQFPSSGSFLFEADNGLGLYKIKPISSEIQQNEKDHIVSILEATDVKFDINNKGYLAADYSVHEVIQTTLGTSDFPSDNFVTIDPDILVSRPFSLAINTEKYLFIAGENQLQLVNLHNGKSGLFANPGLSMAAFMCFDDQGNLYIADAGDDSIKKISSFDVTQAYLDIDNDLGPIFTNLTTISSGDLLADPNGSNIRGPIGIDHSGSQLWVTVDRGTNISGYIVNIDPDSGAQTLFMDDIPGPRGIAVID